MSEALFHRPLSCGRTLRADHLPPAPLTTFDLLSQSVRKVRKAAVRAIRSRRSVPPNRSRRGIRAATWRAESERLCLVDAARAISACYNFATNLQAPLFLLHLIAVSVQSIIGATAKTGALKYLPSPTFPAVCAVSFISRQLSFDPNSAYFRCATAILTQTVGGSWQIHGHHRTKAPGRAETYTAQIRIMREGVTVHTKIMQPLAADLPQSVA